MAIVGLKFFKRNLFACLQEVTSSLRLFKVASSGLQMMKYFSHRHKLQWFETGLKGVVCFKIFQVILNFNFASFKFQTEAKLKFRITWKILKQTTPFSPVSNRCNLCLWEKYFIICRPELATLNKRNELVTSCRHANKFLLKNLKPTIATR